MIRQACLQRTSGGHRVRGWLAGLAAGAAVTLTLSGCLSARRELAREQGDLETAWRRRVALAPPAHPETLDWDAALLRLRAENPKMRAADLDVLRASEALDQTRRSLIPIANFQTGYNRALRSADEVAFDPFYFAATLFFDVPGLVNYRTRYEAAVLAATRARLMRDFTWREQVVELYRQARADARLAGRMADLARQREAIDRLAASAPRTADEERRRILAQRTQLQSDRAQVQDRLGDLLGLSGVTIEIAARGLPPLAYEQADHRPAPAELARLPLRLAAVELVALRARELGVKLQGWPEVNVSVTSPTLYQRNAGQNSYWSTQEVVAGVNAYWTLDTRGHRASEGRIAAAERAARHAVLELEADKIAAKLRAALDGLAGTDREVAALAQAIATAPREVRRPLEESLATVRDERSQWELVLWFFDDARWTPLGEPAAPRAPAAGRKVASLSP